MSDRAKAQKRKAWFVWTLLFVPSSVATVFAINLFGFYRVFPIIMMILAATLLHQRCIKGRAWQSILWGEQRSRD